MSERMSMDERFKRAMEARNTAERAKEQPAPADTQQPAQRRPEEQAAVAAARTLRNEDRVYAAHVRLAELKGEPSPDRALVLERKADVFKTGDVITITDGERLGKITVLDKMKIKSEDGQDRYRVEKTNGDEVILTQEQITHLKSAAERGFRREEPRLEEVAPPTINTAPASADYSQARYQEAQSAAKDFREGKDQPHPVLRQRYQQMGSRGSQYEKAA